MTIQQRCLLISLAVLGMTGETAFAQQTMTCDRAARIEIAQLIEGRIGGERDAPPPVVPVQTDQQIELQYERARAIDEAKEAAHSNDVERFRAALQSFLLATHEIYSIRQRAFCFMGGPIGVAICDDIYFNWDQMPSNCQLVSGRTTNIFGLCSQNYDRRIRDFTHFPFDAGRDRNICTVFWQLADR